MLDAKELDCFQVGENEWVIRRTFRDEQNRRCHQFIAHIASTMIDNKKVAEEFIQGIVALQEKSGLTQRAADDGDALAESELSNDELDTDYEIWANQ
jgi:hypothetical protein